MADNATLQLPRDLIEGAINAHIQTALAAALGDKAKILETAVAQVLTAKVDSEGKPGRGYGHDVEFIQWAVRDCVMKAVREALQQEITKHEAVIKKHIAEQLSRKNSPLLKQLVDTMTTGMVSAASDRWRLTVSYDEKR